jgi:hypothetical protein
MTKLRQLATTACYWPAPWAVLVAETAPRAW